jgi:hypothetical protein
MDEFEKKTGSLTRLKEEIRVLQEALHANTDALELFESNYTKASDAIESWTIKQLAVSPDKLQKKHVREIAALLPTEAGQMLVSNVNSQRKASAVINSNS